MGYTHYWTIKPKNPLWKTGFAQLQMDTKKVLDAVRDMGITLERLNWVFDKRSNFQGMEISERPILEEGSIHFNGGLPADENHEDFQMQVDPMTPYRHKQDSYSIHKQKQYAESHEYWDFCKTARKPYDLAVCTVLIRGVAIMPECLSVGSDGRWDQEWLHGADAGCSDLRHIEVGARQLYPRLFDEEPPDYDILAREDEED